MTVYLYSYYFMSRQVLHVDCDCFFAAVEMRDNPSLINIPIAIGGSSDRRGVISTCNYPARKYGVRSAMSSVKALQLCPHLKLLPGNMAKYQLASQQVMTVLRQYAVQFEQVSIDEAYLEIALTSNAQKVAEQIRQQIANEVGITVSVGVAPNKFLAKVASEWHKPNGQFILLADEVSDFVGALPLQKIPGIGPKSTETLRNMGLNTCQDVREACPKWLLTRFGSMGETLLQRVYGIDHRSLVESRIRKSISVETTLPEDISAIEEVAEVIEGLWLRLCQRLGRNDVSVDGLQPFVKVKFADFHVTTLADHLKGVSKQNYFELVQQAKLRADKKIRLIGIGARLPAQLNPQLSLFQ